MIFSTTWTKILGKWKEFGENFHVFPINIKLNVIKQILVWNFVFLGKALNERVSKKLNFKDFYLEFSRKRLEFSKSSKKAQNCLSNISQVIKFKIQIK